MKVNISATIDAITYEQMETIRKEKRQSRSEYIREALLKSEKNYNQKLEDEQWRLK